VSALGPFCEKVKILSQKFGNVYCHKIGISAKQTQELTLNEVINLYVNKNKFLLILDCWKGQSNPTLQNKNSLIKKKRAHLLTKHNTAEMCSIMSPLSCVLLQTSKKLHCQVSELPILTAPNYELSSRETYIKIHTFIHDQLHVPIYRNMTRYAWYTVKLIDFNRRNWQYTMKVSLVCCFST
jgi:hypothetical protein